MSRARSERRFLRAIVLVACALGAPTMAWAADAQADAARILRSERLEEPAPRFVLSDLAGATVDLHELRGHPVVLHVWATWCAPCRKELPALAALQCRLDAGVRFVAIDIDADAPIERIAGQVRDAGIGFPVVLARSGTVSARYWTWGLPVTYVVDRNGRLRERMRGSRDWTDERIANALAVLLGI